MADVSQLVCLGIGPSATVKFLITLGLGITLPTTPSYRVYTVPGESRTFTPPAESRAYIMESG